ncbi:hypothetical protein BDN70DRAFT_862125 [Pholiota conissans]|uniref:Protein kinase domain-containing protein n=1 Tax=Pholiota conissans TaxID=109636 RepID=A0A9P5YXH6_9AGAR|nr:hypothetical protein BDN70DRAFT_862125 [Pholiota conissans]
MRGISDDLVQDLIPSGSASSETVKFYKPPRISLVDVKEGIDNSIRRGMSPIEQETRLVEVYPWGIEQGTVQFFVEIPAEAPVPHFPQQRLSFFNRNPPNAPSSEALLKNYSAAQQNEETAIVCGRGGESSVPASLYSDILSEFRQNLSSITPTPDDILCFRSLRANLTQIFAKEECRKAKFMEILEKYAVVPSSFSPDLISGTSYRTDVDLRVSFGEFTFLYLISEIKNEVSTTQVEPLIEGSRFWLEQIRTCLKSDNTLAYFNPVNFPVIILLQYGPYLSLAVGIYIDKPIVEYLTCIPMHVHSSNEGTLEAGERAIASPRLALPKLHNSYSSIMTDASKPQAEFLFRNFFEAEGIRRSFVYDSTIEDKRLFHAHLDDDTRVCVKFSRHYSEAAHRAAAELGLALKLYAVNEVYGWFMIVMEDVSEDYQTLWDLKALGKGYSIDDIRRLMLDKLSALHNRQFVHGDVRDVNILVRKDGAAGEGPVIMLVDWDWAGVVGKARYPHSMSSASIRRPNEAVVGGLIAAQHDMDMVVFL